MSPRGAGKVGAGLLVLVVAVLITGQVLGQPIVLGFVETGSMEPTLGSGDGFVAIPSSLTNVEPGDVVVFRAEQIQGGGLVTHRAVGRTEHGYTTKGDANPFTDQEGGEPPIKREQIVATALKFGGGVVTLPHLGTAVQTVRVTLSHSQAYIAGLLGFDVLLGIEGLAYLFFALSVLYYLAGEYRYRNTRSYDRDRNESREAGVDPSLVLGLLAAMLVVAATATMVGPAGSKEFGILSAEFDSDRPTVVHAGETKEFVYGVPNDGFVPVVVFLEAREGVTVGSPEMQVLSRTVINTTLTLHAPPQTGYYRYYVTEHRYLAILPTSTIRTLYEIHPWLPVVVIDAMIAGAFLALTLPFVGKGRIRDRSRDGASRSLLTRLVR